MLMSIALAFVLILVTSLFHFAVLRWLSVGLAQYAMAGGTRVASIVFVLFAAHLIEMALYAFAFFVGDQTFEIGELRGETVSAPLDYFYFSITSYTSLGVGDLFPADHLRFLAGVEALNGLLLIAWSGSLIYIAMGRSWRWDNCKGAEHHPET